MDPAAVLDPPQLGRHVRLEPVRGPDVQPHGDTVRQQDTTGRCLFIVCHKSCLICPKSVANHFCVYSLSLIMSVSMVDHQLCLFLFKVCH